MEKYRPAVERDHLEIPLDVAIQNLIKEGTQNVVQSPYEAIIKRPISKAELRNTADHLINRMEIQLQEFGDPMILTTGAEASVPTYLDRLKHSRFSIHNHPHDLSILLTGIHDNEGDLPVSLKSSTEIDFIINPLGIIAYQPRMTASEIKFSNTFKEKLLSVLDNSIPFWTRLLYRKGIIRTSLSWDDPKVDVIVDYINSPAKKWDDIEGSVRGLSIIPALFKD